MFTTKSISVLFFIYVLLSIINVSFSLKLRPLKMSSVLIEKTETQVNKLPWKPEGYQTWIWNGHKINYINYGSSSKPPLLLIHGFGASVYHWRYNIPALSEVYNVFAFDMLGKIMIILLCNFDR
jgi:hypothetical protein